MRDSSAIAVAELSAPHGVRGWVRVRLYDPDSTALRPGLRVELRPPGEGARPSLSVELLAVEPVPGKSFARVHFAGVADRDRAEALRGYQVWVPRDALPALDEGEFYLDDTLGLPVRRVLGDSRTQQLGVVAGVTSNGAQDLLEVEWTRPDGRRDTWLLPVVPHFIVELDAHGLLVDLPQGLLPDALEAAADEVASS